MCLLFAAASRSSFAHTHIVLVCILVLLHPVTFLLRLSLVVFIVVLISVLWLGLVLLARLLHFDVAICIFSVLVLLALAACARSVALGRHLHPHPHRLRRPVAVVVGSWPTHSPPCSPQMCWMLQPVAVPLLLDLASSRNRLRHLACSATPGSTLPCHSRSCRFTVIHSHACQIQISRRSSMLLATNSMRRGWLTLSIATSRQRMASGPRSDYFRCWISWY